MKIIVERLPRIFLLTLVVLLAAIVAIQDSYLIRTLKEIRQNTADAGNVINDCREELDACRDASRGDFDKSEHIYNSHMMKYEGQIDSYKIFFEYPEDYSVMEFAEKGKSQIVVYNDIENGDKEEASKLVVISNQAEKLAYDPIQSEKQTEQDRMGVVGLKTLNFDYFMMGDGDMGGFGGEGNYLANIDSNLWVSVNFESSYENIKCITPKGVCPLADLSKCVTKAVCDANIDYGKFNEVSTSELDINNGFKILESLKWEKIQ